MATTYPDTTGTTSPIFVPRSPGPGVIAPGKCYFTIKIAAAQAAYFGPIWDQPNKLIVTSQVVIDHPALGNEPLRAIQRSRQIRRNGVEQLGLSSNLIKLVPATMKSVSISIEFIVDVKNKLDGLTTLINSDAFLAAASFAPGGAVVAKTVGGIAQQLMQTFFTAEEQKPILQFSGDFNISTKELRDGYYVVLGTRDPANSFPRPMPQLAVENSDLMVGGGVATRWSYVIFDVRSVEVRGRDSSGGAPWDKKLRLAEAEAQSIAHDFSATSADRRSAWERCMSLIREAQVLIAVDPEYLREEAQQIINEVYDSCSTSIRAPHSVRGTPSSEGALIDSDEDRASLGIPDQVTLLVERTRYRRALTESHRILEG